MKKYSKLTAALVAGCLMMQAGQALAGTVTAYKEDSAIIFPGSTPNATWDNVDNLGTPQLTGLTVNWNNTTGQLLSITIDSVYNPVDYSSFASLYINTAFNGTAADQQSWDYLVHTGAQTNANYASGPVPGDGLYKVASSFNPTTDYTTVVAGNNGRTGHADSISTSKLTATGDTPSTNLASNVQVWDPTANGGVGGYVSGYSFTYDFASLSTAIYLFGAQGVTTGNFIIGYTPYCANDVIFEQFKSTDGKPLSSVPEPVSMMLFGAGLAGLAGWRARRKISGK